MIEILSYPFFQRALLGVALISVAIAIVGVYVMSRRMVFISGGITHACFGGLGLGYWLGVSPLAMAGVSAILGSMGVQWLTDRRGARADSAIAVVWALGMALGIIFIFLTHGYVPELNSFLFGNVLTVTDTDLWVFAAFTATLLGMFALMGRTIVSVAFDPDFAAVHRLPVRWVSYIMTVVTAIAIVLAIRLAGIMLLMSLLSLPQMVAETRARRYPTLMLASAAVSLLCGVGGLFLAWAINVPASATIVLLLVAVYLISQIRTR